MRDTGFLRYDGLPGRTALGYLAAGGEPRTNVFHLPVMGSGDGRIYSTAADINALWQSVFTSKIVPTRWVAEVVPGSAVTCTVISKQLRWRMAADPAPGGATR